MPRELSLAHLTALHLTPPALVEAAAGAGFEFVGLRLTAVTPGGVAYPLHEDPALMRETRARLADTGVRVLDVELIKLEPGTDVAEFEPVVAAAAELGARHMLTQGHDPDFSRVTDRYAAFCDLTARYGMTSDIEFLTWTDLNNLDKAAALVRAAGRPNGGILIDTLHFFRSGCRPEEIADVPTDWLHFIHLSDAPAEAPTTVDGLLHTAREARLLPGEGGLDLAGVLRRLPAGRPIALEIPNAEMAQAMSDEERVRRAREATLRLLAEAEACDASRSDEPGAAPSSRM